MVRPVAYCALLGYALATVQPASSIPEIPESIGPYRIVAKIGEGGMGVVYKAQDQRLQRVVALKVIREFDSDSTRRQRFWQEARSCFRRRQRRHSPRPPPGHVLKLK